MGGWGPPGLGWLKCKGQGRKRGAPASRVELGGSCSREQGLACSRAPPGGDVKEGQAVVTTRGNHPPTVGFTFCQR